jgi:hypothetical protein
MMQILIDIDEETYKARQHWVANQKRVVDHVDIAIANGTPLPKHGDLVDRDEINNRFNAIWDELESLSNKPTYKELLDKFSMCLDTAKPVIKNNYEDVEEDLCS